MKKRKWRLNICFVRYYLDNNDGEYRCRSKVPVNEIMKIVRMYEPIITEFFKNEEEINEMFNSGVFNEIVKGYVSMFLKQEHGGLFGDDAIKIAMRDIDILFDEVSSKEAREYYKRRYCK